MGEKNNTFGIAACVFQISSVSFMMFKLEHMENTHIIA